MTCVSYLLLRLLPPTYRVPLPQASGRQGVGVENERQTDRQTDRRRGKRESNIKMVTYYVKEKQRQMHREIGRHIHTVDTEMDAKKLTRTETMLI